MSAPDPALVDLLGLVAYGELLAFDRLAADARLAPDLRRRAALSEMAGAEIAHYRWIADRITALGVTPDEAMAPYVEALRAYHDSTEPKDWLEAVTKAYVGDAISDDFLREIVGGLDGPDRRLILDVLLGDPPLFPTTEEVNLSWKILDPIEEFWSTLGQPQPYRSGTWGPEEAVEMLARDGHRWRMP